MSSLAEAFLSQTCQTTSADAGQPDDDKIEIAWSSEAYGSYPIALQACIVKFAQATDDSKARQQFGPLVPDSTLRGWLNDKQRVLRLAEEGRQREQGGGRHTKLSEEDEFELVNYINKMGNSISPHALIAKAQELSMDQSIGKNWLASFHNRWHLSSHRSSKRQRLDTSEELSRSQKFFDAVDYHRLNGATAAVTWDETKLIAQSPADYSLLLPPGMAIDVGSGGAPTITSLPTRNQSLPLTFLRGSCVLVLRTDCRPCPPAFLCHPLSTPAGMGMWSRSAENLDFPEDLPLKPLVLETPSGFTNSTANLSLVSFICQTAVTPGENVVLIDDSYKVHAGKLESKFFLLSGLRHVSLPAAMTYRLQAQDQRLLWLWKYLYFLKFDNWCSEQVLKEKCSQSELFGLFNRLQWRNKVIELYTRASFELQTVYRNQIAHAFHGTGLWPNGSVTVDLQGQSIKRTWPLDPARVTSLSSLSPTLAMYQTSDSDTDDDKDDHVSGDEPDSEVKAKKETPDARTSPNIPKTKRKRVLHCSGCGVELRGHDQARCQHYQTIKAEKAARKKEDNDLLNANIQSVKIYHQQ